MGEIESYLSQHPTVQESVVIAREEKTGEKRLVAYLPKKWRFDGYPLKAGQNLRTKKLGRVHQLIFMSDEKLDTFVKHGSFWTLTTPNF